MSAPTRRRYVLGLVYAEGDRVTTEAGTWTVHPNLCGTHPSSSMFVVGCRKMTGPRDARGFNGFGGTIRDDEMPLSAMIRELREESGLTVAPTLIRPFGTLGGETWTVDLFAMAVPLGQAPGIGERDAVLVAPADRLPVACAVGMRALVPLGLLARSGTLDWVTLACTT